MKKGNTARESRKKNFGNLAESRQLALCVGNAISSPYNKPLEVTSEKTPTELLVAASRYYRPSCEDLPKLNRGIHFLAFSAGEQDLIETFSDQAFFEDPLRINTHRLTAFAQQLAG
jgi:hypothetical protein